VRPVKLIIRNVLNRLGFEVVKTPALVLHHQLLREMIPKLAIDVVIDVGAHEGEFGSYLRRTVGYTGKIVSFEPIQSSFAKLAARASRDPAWTVHDHGLGPRRETRTINVMRSSDYSSLLAARSDNPQLSSVLSVDRTETIALETLDDLADAVAPPGSRVFLKTDTQGFDLEVMRGATRFLERVSMVQMECASKQLYERVPLYDEVVAFMRERGYGLAGMFPLARDSNLTVIEFDCVLVNERIHRATISTGPTSSTGATT
jgi:FkbM family methyltransferase